MVHFTEEESGQSKGNATKKWDTNHSSTYTKPSWICHELAKEKKNTSCEWLMEYSRDTLILLNTTGIFPG